jgi:hypothetical protein
VAAAPDAAKADKTERRVTCEWCDMIDLRE